MPKTRGESFSFRTTRSPPSPRTRCSTSSTTRRPPLWARRLYEAYRARGARARRRGRRRPHDPGGAGAEFARRLCGRLGLDPEQACLSWDPPTTKERAAMHPAYYASQRFLIESSGVDATRAGRNRDLEAEVRGWPEEFGEDVGMIREMVDLAMPNYRYLLGRRFRM
ncbi:hypothetical protein PG988_006424 [Apiospora saccharicola]